MPFPKRFKHLLEPDPESVPLPDYVWLSWSVCACDESACGWSGWTIAAVFRRTAEHYPTGTGDQALRAQDEQKCPRCGRDLFGTGIEVRYEPSVDQAPPHGTPGVDYEVSDMEYE